MKNTARKCLSLVSKPEWAFVVLASIFGLFSAFLVPQLTVNDENMHFLRAYNLSTGSLGSHACSYPDIGKTNRALRDGNFVADFSEKVNLSKEMPQSCGSAASYSPFMHFPQALGVLVAKTVYPSTGLMILLGRIANLAFYVIALYFIIRYARLGKWVFVVVALLPISVHTAGSLSSDVMNNVVVFAFIAFMFNLFIQKNEVTRKQIVILLALAGLLALTKITNVVLLLPLAFLPIKLFNKNSQSWQWARFSIRKWLLVLSCVAVSVVCFLSWQYIYGSSVVGEPTSTILNEKPLFFLTVLSNTFVNPYIGYTDIVVRGVVGEFSSFRYHLPTFAVIFVYGVLFFSLLRKNEREDRAARAIIRPLAISSTVALCLLVVGVSYAMYTAWAVQPFRLGPNAPYADGVQGRYFTATLCLLLPLFLVIRRYISIEVKSDKVFGLMVFGCCAASLIFYTITTYRYIV